jgi:hypothetical protein
VVNLPAVNLDHLATGVSMPVPDRSRAARPFSTSVSAAFVTAVALAIVAGLGGAACKQEQNLGGDGGLSPDMTSFGDMPVPIDQPGGGGDATGACSVDPSSTSYPPYPFDYARFTSSIVPLIVNGKTQTGTPCINCHAAGSQPFGIPADASDPCTAQTLFTELVGATAPACNADSGGRVRLDDVASSKILARFVAGAANGHNGGAWFASTSDGNYLALFNFINDAKTKGCSPTTTTCNYDQAAFNTKVAPVLDSKKCGQSGCHIPGGGRIFIWSQMATDPAVQQQNLMAFKTYASLDDPPSSPILHYGLGENNHTGGTLWMMGDQSYTAILDFIQSTAQGCGPITPDALCPNGNPAPDVTAINVRAFARFLWPTVLGPSSVIQTSAGCGENSCHGNAVPKANPAGLRLRDPDLYCQAFGSDPDCQAPDKETVIHTENVRQLMCLTNAQTPLRSPILTCPLGLGPPDCPIDHSLMGGGQRFTQTDANYLALANFVYSTRGNLGVHDDVFYTRVLVPEFTSTQFTNGAAVRSCGQQGCHVPGGDPLFDDPSHMASASIFLDFFNPKQSGLFLFPTDLSPLDPLVGNPANAGNAKTIEGLNILRFGATPHDSGGPGAVLDINNNFDGDANQQRLANELLHFLPGLQPDPNDGSVTDFLIPVRRATTRDS